MLTLFVGFGSSHATHFTTEASLGTMHVPHVHLSVVVDFGIVIPAAAQLKPPPPPPPPPLPPAVAIGFDADTSEPKVDDTGSFLVVVVIVEEEEESRSNRGRVSKG